MTVLKVTTHDMPGALEQNNQNDIMLAGYPRYSHPEEKNVYRVKTR